MIISFLGIDGSGKSTHLQKLKKEITSDFNIGTRIIEKRDLLKFDEFPEAKFIGVPYEILAHECLPRMKGVSRALWLIYMYSVILGRYPPLDNEIILIDGYWDKNYATEAALGVNKEWIRQVGSILPKPDFTILLDVTPEAVLKRDKTLRPYESGCDMMCKETSFLNHQKKVRKYIFEICDGKNVKIINGSQSVQDVYKEIKEDTYKEIKKKFKI